MFIFYLALKNEPTKNFTGKCHVLQEHPNMYN